MQRQNWSRSENLALLLGATVWSALIQSLAEWQLAAPVALIPFLCG